MEVGNIKTIKCRLKTILTNTDHFNKIKDCIQRTNSIVLVSSYFIRLYLLHENMFGYQLPDLDHSFIKLVFSLFGNQNKRGPKMGKEKLKVLDRLQKFKISVSPLFDTNYNSTNLGYMLNYEAIKMQTSYINNIKLNFIKYLFQFVNESHSLPSIKRVSKMEYRQMLPEQKLNYQEKNNEIREKKKQQLKELSLVKKDLINGTLLSDEKYHKWILMVRKHVLPERKYELLLDVHKYPFKYLKTMLLMDSLLEEKGKKMFQVIPLRTDISDKYITFDIRAIKDIFTEIKANGENELTSTQTWNKYFKITPNKFRIKNYSFNGLISTDGIGCSISFIEKSALKRKEELTKMKLKASKESKKLKKQGKVYHKIKSTIKFHKIKDNEEFIDIEDAIKDKKLLNHLKQQYEKGKIVVGDPGKRSPLTLKGKDGIFNYRKRRRLVETKRLKYTKLRQNYYKQLLRKHSNLNEKDKELKTVNFKTTGYTKFMVATLVKFSYLKIYKEERLQKDFSNYNNKLKWFSYINTKRHEDTIINEIKNKYGKGATIIVGDWSKNDYIKGISAPNMNIKRKLKETMEVLTIDEYNTSKIHYKTEVECNNLRITKTYNKDGEEHKSVRKIHAVLTYQTGKRSGCINRDINATKNMIKIVRSLIFSGNRPEIYKRKPSNPTLVGSINR